MNAVYCLSGFSEKILDVLAALDEDRNALIPRIEAVCDLPAGGSPMLCPYCQKDIDQKWQPLHFQDAQRIAGVADISAQLRVDGTADKNINLEIVRAHWMRCPNEKCLRPLIRLATLQHYPGESSPREAEFIALPQWPSDRIEAVEFV